MVHLEFSRRYSMAHRLLFDPLGKCMTPHGHDELVVVTLSPLGPLDAGRSNMNAAFEQAKGRWHRWIDSRVDHAFQLNSADPLIDFFRRHEPARLDRLMVFDGDPTTEALTIAFLRKLRAFLAVDGVFRVEMVRVQETPTNSAFVRAADVEAMDWTPGAWADRADDSINDF